MLSTYIALLLGHKSAISPITTPLDIHNITRFADLNFENLAIRPDGQILTTTAWPNASIYQVDPLDILPPTLIYTIPGVMSATGIVEGSPDVYYVASGTINITRPFDTFPDTYAITEIDLCNVSVLPDGSLTQEPKVRRVASLPDAALPNGIAFARPGSDSLLVADSFRRLIWNVNVTDGAIGITLNDSTTRGSTETGPSFTGVNGLKVHDGEMYWTSTGLGSLFKVPIDQDGKVAEGQVPTLIASNIACDDFVVDSQESVYVASGPQNVITKISPTGETQVVAGIFDSNSSGIIGPTAVKFGRLSSDRWSIYITTNGGLAGIVPGSAGLSRVDLSAR